MADEAATKSSIQTSRRDILRNGALLVPALMTFRAQSGLAQPMPGPNGTGFANPLEVLNRNYQGTELGGNAYRGYAGANAGSSTFQVYGEQQSIVIDPINDFQGVNNSGQKVWKIGQGNNQQFITFDN